MVNAYGRGAPEARSVGGANEGRGGHRGGMRTAEDTWAQVETVEALAAAVAAAMAAASYFGTGPPPRADDAIPKWRMLAPLRWRSGTRRGQGHRVDRAGDPPPPSDLEGSLPTLEPIAVHLECVRARPHSRVAAGLQITSTITAIPTMNCIVFPRRRALCPD